MRTILGFCAVLLILLPVSVYAEELVVLKEVPMVEMLNNFQLLAERKEPPYAIRVIRLPELGECDGTPQSCPKTNLYIAVSTTFDEAPDQQVYKLPEAYGWEFVRWKVVAREEGRASYTIIEMKRKIIAKDLAKGWWAYATYEISVNPWQGRLREVQKSE